MVKVLFTKKQIATLEKHLSQLKGDGSVNEQISKSIEVANLLMGGIKKYFGTSPEIIKSFLAEHNLSEPYLARILGSRSRASDLLSGKRTATLSDIRLLKSSLGIPAELFFMDSSEGNIDTIDYARYPVAEMVKRGWLPNNGTKKGERDSIETLCVQTGLSFSDAHAACFRQLPRKNAKTDSFALQAWLLGVRLMAQKLHVRERYNGKIITAKFLETVVHELASSSRGLQSVQQYLAAKGIRFLMVPHLKGTHLDGAVFFAPDGVPVIALTGRYDRLDNFWFTLTHELAHLVLGHVSPNGAAIFDDMDLVPQEKQEIEADSLAREAMIPMKRWCEFPVKRCSHGEIFDLALELGVSPAIVAGRVRFETKNYRAFTNLVGHGEVRKQFPEVFCVDNMS